MYEKLTCFDDKFTKTESGKWVFETDDGIQQMPWVHYSQTIFDFIREVHLAADQHEELKHYRDILEKNKKNSDISSFDDLSVLAMLLSIVRSERVCEGSIKQAIEKGTVQKCLNRLRELDKKT